MRIGIDLGGTKTEVIALSEQGSSCFAIVCQRRAMIITRLSRRLPAAGRDGRAGDRANRQRRDGDTGVDLAVYRRG